MHRAPGGEPGSLVGTVTLVLWPANSCYAGGLLVVPVLQPDSDQIPFGLALSWQRQSAACHPASNDLGHKHELYELQYVLDGEGEVSVPWELNASC